MVCGCCLKSCIALLGFGLKKKKVVTIKSLTYELFVINLCIKLSFTSVDFALLIYSSWSDTVCIYNN